MVVKLTIGDKLTHVNVNVKFGYLTLITPPSFLRIKCSLGARRRRSHNDFIRGALGISATPRRSRECTVR